MATRIPPVVVLSLLLTFTQCPSASSSCLEAEGLSAEAAVLVGSSPKQAEAKLRQAVAACGESAALRYNLGMSLYRQGQIREARVALEGALEKGPEFGRALNGLAYLLTLEPEPDPVRALALAQKASKLSPDDADVRDTLAKAEAAAGNFADIEMPMKSGASLPDAVAVVIGNKTYRNRDIYEVAYAQADAEAVKQYLVRTLGYDPRNIFFLTDASSMDFNTIFGTQDRPQGKLYNWVKPGQSDVFVYYTGHGAPDPDSQRAYFVPADADPNYLGISGYPLDLFWDNLSKIPAKSMTVVLDTCFSGNSEKGLIIQNVSPLILKTKTSLVGPEGSVVMTSGSVDQVSNWYPEKRHGLFTYFWLKAVTGAADADSDRVITVGDIKRYLSNNVPYVARRLAGREQKPVVKGDDSKVFVHLP